VKFSVVIPVFGTEQYLPRCLDSIKAQTDRDFEIVVVDDCSPGNCAEVVRLYGDSVRYVRHAKNRGAFQARCTGVEAAKGEYIVPVDPDDYLLPETLARVRDVIDRERPDVVTYWIDCEDGSKVWPHWCRHPAATTTALEMLREMAAQKTMYSIVSKVVRRDVYQRAMAALELPPDAYVNTSEDFLTTLAIVLCCDRISHLDYAGYRYFSNPTSITASRRSPAGLRRAREQSRFVHDAIRALAERVSPDATIPSLVRNIIALSERWIHAEAVTFWSFVFAVGVVVIHCAWRPETELGRLSAALFRDTLARMAVPFFFVCSGFFLARHFDEPGWWRREVVKRLRSLVVPYVLWTFAFATVLYVEAHERMGVGGFGLNPCKMPALAPLWYVRCVMAFVVAAPVLKAILERGRVWTLAVSYGLLLGFVAVACGGRLSAESGIGGFLFHGLSLSGLTYFLVGIYLQRTECRAPSRSLYVGALAAGLVLVALRLWMVHANIAAEAVVGQLLIPPMLVGLWGLVWPFPLPGILRGCAFPIFLMHGIVIASLRYWGGAYHVCNPWLEFFLGVTVPIVFCNLVRRIVPRGASLLFGGRAF